MSEQTQNSVEGVEAVANASIFTEEVVVESAQSNDSFMSFDDENVESKLGFILPKETGYIPRGTIDSVSFKMREIPTHDKDGKESTWELAGLTIPVLSITFKQEITATQTHHRYCTKEFSIPTFKKKDGSMVAMSKRMNLVKGIFGHLQHICNQLKKLEGYPKDAPKAPGIDLNCPNHERVEQFTKFFNHFYSLLTTKKDDKYIWENKLFWIKLLPDYDSKKFYTIPSFVNRGWLELAMPNVAPALCIEPGDDIELTAEKKGNTEKSVEAGNAVDTPDVDPEIANYLKMNGMG